MLAAASVNPSSHTVDQAPFCSCTSSRPCVGRVRLLPPFTRRTDAEGWGQREVWGYPYHGFK